MARRYQVKIYSVDFTTLQATVPDFDLYSCPVVYEVNAAYNMSCVIARSSSAYSYVALGKTVELNNTVTGVKRHFRMVRVTDMYVGRKPAVEVFCEGLHYDLASKIKFDASKFIEQTPTTIMTAILSTFSWAVGTVTPTAKVTLEYNYQTVLELLQQLAEKTGYELDYTTSPGVSPTRQVHLRTIGNQSSTSTVTLGKNLLTIKRDTSLSKANIVYGLGGTGSKGRVMTMANATHRITAINSNTLTLDSTKILGSDNGYTSMSIVKPNGTITAITAAQKSTLDKITVASAANLAVNDKIRFIFTSNSSPVEFVLNSDRIATESSREGLYRNETLVDVENLVGPAASSAFDGPYTSGLCTGWLKNGGGTTTENSDTNYIINGSRSQKFTVTADTSTPTVTSSLATAYETNIEGTIRYKAALLGADGEGQLSAASTGLAVSLTGITVVVNPGLTAGHVIGARVYRSVNGGVYKHNRDIVGNDSYTFVDLIDSAALGEEPPADTTKLTGGQGIYYEFPTVVGKEYAAVAYFFVTSGKIRVVLDVGEKVPNDELQPDSICFSSSSYAQTAALQGVIATQTTGRLYFLTHQGPATFYADSAMVVQNPIPPDQANFIADNSATTLWYETYDEMRRFEAEADLRQYDLNIADLYEAGIGSDPLNLGDLITVTDANVGVNSSLRITAKRFDAVEPEKDVSFELSSLYRRERDEIYERRKSEQAIMAALRKQVTSLSEQLSAITGSDRRPILTARTITTTAV